MPELAAEATDKNTTTNGPLKRKSDDDNSIARTKSKRDTATIERLGVAEYEANDDDLFESIRQQQHENNGAADVDMNGKDNENITPKSPAELDNDTANGHQTNNENSVGITTNRKNKKINETYEQMMSPGEQIIYAKLLDMIAELKLVQKSVSELSAKQPYVKENEKCLKQLKRNELIEVGLPIENLTQMESFERKLQDDVFYRKMVYKIHYNFVRIADVNIYTFQHTYLFQFDLLKMIGGTEGKSSGDMVMVAIFGYLIEPQFLKTISWTGKSDSKSKKKIRFEKFAGLIGLINEVCIAADERYTDVQCKKDMVYKVFKYAYRIKSDSESNDTTQNKSNPTTSMPNVQNNKGIMQASQPNAAITDQTNQQQQQHDNHSSNLQHFRVGT